MTIIQGILLGLLQGIAEFLPISSSGHLKVAQFFFGLTEVPLLFDVLLHVATLAAVSIYFRKVIGKLFGVLFRLVLRKPEPVQAFNISSVSEVDIKTETLVPNDEIGRKTILMIILTTIVTGILGIVSKEFMPELSMKFIAIGFLITAILLIASAVISKRTHGDFEPETELRDNIYAVQSRHINWIQAAIIGVAQGIGTLPGISRSGSTIAGAALCGVDRRTAGDYSFIVSIPAILGAFILTLKDAVEKSSEEGQSLINYFSQTVGILPAIIGFIVAFLSGYFALSCLMKIIHKGKLEWFAAYLIPLGIFGLIFF